MPLKNLYLIVGHSGSGKTTIVNELHRRYGYMPLSSYTTRPKRSENEEGHEFISKEQFDALEGMLAYTKFNGYEYCATQEQADRSDLYVIDPKGIFFMREKYRSERPVKVIGIHVPCRELEQRMLARGDTPDMVKTRMENDEIMFGGMDDICDVIVRNDDLEGAVEFIHDLILRFEGVRNPDLQHLMLIEATKSYSRVLEEQVRYVFNKEKLTPKGAEQYMRSGQYTPFGIEMPKAQWLALFKNENVIVEEELV